MSFLIKCPHCGDRGVYEFRFGGEVKARPEPGAYTDLCDTSARRDAGTPPECVAVARAGLPVDRAALRLADAGRLVLQIIHRPTELARRGAAHPSRGWTGRCAPAWLQQRRVR